MVVDGDLADAQRIGYLLIGLFVGKAQEHNLFSDGRLKLIDELS